MSRALAALFPPVVVLASAHELYLRNQEDLHHSLSVLFPFWAAGLAAAVVAVWLQRGGDSPAVRGTLWAYYAAGFAFLLWGFLRGLPLAGGLALWTLDTVPGSLLFAAAAISAAVAAFRRLSPRAVEPALAVLALVLAVREGVALVSRLDTAPPPSIADIPEALGAGGNARLPNVYHVLLDAFQDELFEPRRPPGREALFSGFVRMRLDSPMRHTMSVLPWILSGEWSGDARTRIQRTLTGEGNVFSDFRRAGYRTVGFVPAFIYRANPPPLDVLVFLDDSVLLEGRDADRVRGMHAGLFRQLWAFSVLPAGLSQPLARTNRLGLDPGTLRSVGALRISALAQPVVSRLGMERFLEAEPLLPARGRYTFIHLLLPHSPHVLRADCTEAAAGTDLLQETECTLGLVDRLLATLGSLGRLDDSVILIHGDHGSGYALRDGRLAPDPSGDLRTLLLAKPAGARGPLRAEAGHARVVDIAPTLLALAGVRPARELDGRVLEDVVR